MRLDRRVTLDEIERDMMTEHDNGDNELPWVPGKVMRPGLKMTCALCGGELSTSVTGETCEGENVHECLDCGAQHRAIMARPFRGHECRPNRNNFRGVI